MPLPVSATIINPQSIFNPHLALKTTFPDEVYLKAFESKFLITRSRSWASVQIVAEMGSRTNWIPLVSATDENSIFISSNTSSKEKVVGLILMLLESNLRGSKFDPPKLLLITC